MNKKKLVALVITVLMLVPTGVFAKENPHKGNNDNKGGITITTPSITTDDNSAATNDQQDNKDQADQQGKGKGAEKKAENQANRDAKKQQIADFKAQMKAKHETMKQLRIQINAQKQLAQSKMAQLQAIISDIEAGKKTLSQDMLTALLSKVANLTLDGQQLKTTTDVNNQVSDTQDKINKQDFNNALASMDNVIAKLQARLDGLTQLNKDLDDLLAIANLATTPSTSGTTAPATSGDSTTPSTGSGTTTTTTTPDNGTTTPTQNQSTTTGTSSPTTTTTTSGTTN